MPDLHYEAKYGKSKVRRPHRIRVTRDSEVLDERCTYKLNGNNFDPVLPPTLAADCRQVLRHFAIPDATPIMIRKLRSNQTGAGIINGILEIVYLEKCLPNVGDRVGDYRVEANTFTIKRRSRKTRKTLGARLYLLVQHHIKVKRQTPVEARAEDPLKVPESNQYAFLVGEQNDKRYEGLERPLYNLKELIEQDEPPRRLIGFSDYLGVPKKPKPPPVPDGLSAGAVHKRYGRHHGRR
jgi:hypothetical protein